MLSLAQFLGQDCVEGQLGPHRLLGIIVLSCEAAHGFNNDGLEDHLADGSYLKELGEAFHQGAMLVKICQACASATPSLCVGNSLLHTERISVPGRRGVRVSKQKAAAHSAAVAL